MSKTKRTIINAYGASDYRMVVSLMKKDNWELVGYTNHSPYGSHNPHYEIEFKKIIENKDNKNEST